MMTYVFQRIDYLGMIAYISQRIDSLCMVAYIAILGRCVYMVPFLSQRIDSSCICCLRILRVFLLACPKGLILRVWSLTNPKD